MSDQDTLARTIWGEARGEGVRGMTAVACVIRNRVNLDLGHDGKPDWWGEGYEGVCKARLQFSCWNADDPNLTKLLVVGAEDPQFVIATRISGDVIDNMVDDPTGGATHYHDTRMPRPPEWAQRVSPTVIIGHHAFYRLAS